MKINQATDPFRLQHLVSINGKPFEILLQQDDPCNDNITIIRAKYGNAAKYKAVLLYAGFIQDMPGYIEEFGSFDIIECFERFLKQVIY